MTADMLIMKKKGHKVEVKVTKWANKSYVPDHKIIVNLNSYKDVAFFLHDLKCLFNVQIDKAIKEYQSRGDGDWLF